MNELRTLQYILGELQEEFPSLKLVQLARLINRAYDDGDNHITVEGEENIDVVDGTRFYDIPLDDNGSPYLSVVSVHYKNSRDKYVPLARHVGATILGDTL